jgi:transposase
MKVAERYLSEIEEDKCGFPKRDRQEMLLDEWERGGGSAAQFADYVGIKYSTLANWIQKRRKQAGLNATLLKPGGVDSSKSHGHWVEAIVEKKPVSTGFTGW